MSAEATGWVWKHSPYRGMQLLVHLAIADVVNDANDNDFWMSSYGLAKKARVSRSTVVSTLGDMLERGFLTVAEAGKTERKPTRYHWPTRPTDGIARPIERLPLGQEMATELVYELKNTKAEASRSGDGLADCVRCRGRGTVPSGAGERPCSCVEADTRSVVDGVVVELAKADEA